MASATKTAPKKRTLRKGLLTFLTIGAVGAVGVFASTAALSDDAAFLAAEAHGGTLAIEQTDATTFGITGVENLVPYNVPGGIKGWKTSLIEVQNTGSLPGNVDLVASGTDANDCFETYIAESNPAVGWHPISTTAGNQWGGPSPQGTKSYALGQVNEGVKRKFKVAIRMKGSCVIGSGLNSGGDATLGEAADNFAPRHIGHAQASLTLTFKIDQLSQVGVD